VKKRRSFAYPSCPLYWINVVWADAKGATTAALKNPTRALENFMVTDQLVVLDLNCKREKIKVVVCVSFLGRKEACWSYNGVEGHTQEQAPNNQQVTMDQRATSNKMQPP
jgi:hypothetical protein